MRSARWRVEVLGAGMALAVAFAPVPMPPVMASSTEPRTTTSPATPPPVPAVSARERQRAYDRAIEHVLARTGVVRAGGSQRRDVALTFDDGPGPWTTRILRTLERHRAPATFFVVGREAAARPGVVRREIRDGFAVEDHTQDHVNLAASTPTTQRAQIAHGAAAIVAAGAPVPRLLRPPYGAFGTTTLRILAAEHRLLVLWSVDTRDYTRPGVDRIVATALAGARPGSIVLLHDGGGDRRQTAAAVAPIVRRLRQRHFHLVTVPELMLDDPPHS